MYACPGLIGKNGGNGSRDLYTGYGAGSFCATILAAALRNSLEVPAVEEAAAAGFKAELVLGTVEDWLKEVAVRKPDPTAGEPCKEDGPKLRLEEGPIGDPVDGPMEPARTVCA